MKTGIAYFGNRMPKHVVQDINDIVEHGCTYIVHTFSENDWMFYHQTMKEIFELTHRAGLDAWVDPWGVGHIFGGEAYSLWVARNPDFCQRDAAGRHIPAACFNQPPFREFIRRWIDAALELAPDMIFWDEVHLYVGIWHGEPERWSCRCDICRDLYRQQHGEDMPPVRSDPSVQAFRAWTVLDFLSDAIGYTHRQGAHNALCLYPEEAVPDPGPDWKDIVQIPGLDNLGTDPYPFTKSNSLPITKEQWTRFVEGNARKIVQLTREQNINNHFWIQAFNVPTDDTGYIEGAAALAVREGITNLAAWGYDACGHISSIACEQPAVVWDAIGKIYRSMRQLPMSQLLR